MILGDAGALMLRITTSIDLMGRGLFLKMKIIKSNQEAIKCNSIFWLEYLHSIKIAGPNAI